MNPPFASASIVAKPQCNQPSIASRAKQVGLTWLSTERSRRGGRWRAVGLKRRAHRGRDGRVVCRRAGRGRPEPLASATPGGFRHFLYHRARKRGPAGRFPEFPSPRAAVSYRNSRNPPPNRENPCTALQELAKPDTEGRNRCTEARKVGKSETPPTRRAQLRPSGTWRRRAMRMRTPAKRAQFRPSGELDQN